MNGFQWIGLKWRSVSVDGAYVDALGQILLFVAVDDRLHEPRQVDFVGVAVNASAFRLLSLPNIQPILLQKKKHTPRSTGSAHIPLPSHRTEFRLHFVSIHFLSLSLCLSFIFDLLLLKIISIVAIFSIRIRFSSFFLLFSVFWLFCCPSD